MTTESERLKVETKRYAKARGMTVAEFKAYCVALYINTTPEDPNDLGDVGYE